MNKIIAIDFDGVISNPYKIKLKLLRKMGYDISINQITYGGCVKTGIVSETDYNYANKKSLNAGPDQVELEKHFLEYYKKLLKLPCKFYIVSSRNNIDMKALHSIVKYYRIKIDGIINTNNKNKYFSLSAISADLFIEDNSFFIAEIVKKLRLDLNNQMKIIYYKNSVNIDEKINNSYIKSIKGWKNVYKYINSIVTKNES